MTSFPECCPPQGITSWARESRFHFGTGSTKGRIFFKKKSLKTIPMALLRFFLQGCVNCVCRPLCCYWAKKEEAYIRDLGRFSFVFHLIEKPIALCSLLFFLPSFGWAKSIKQHNRIIDPVCVCSIPSFLCLPSSAYTVESYPPRWRRHSQADRRRDQSSDGRRGVCVCVGRKKHTHTPTRKRKNKSS